MAKNLFKRLPKKSRSSERSRFGFLPEESEVARLIRERDWSETPIGDVEEWPQPLKTALALCLDSKCPVFVWWGEDLIQFYNDASLSVLRAKHPNALGRPARKAWSDIWSEVGPHVEQVMTTGKGVTGKDFEVVPERDSTFAPAYFSFCYSALRDEDGAVAGVFISTVETTPRVRSEAALRENEERLRCIVESAKEYAIITLDAEGCITSWNSGAERLLGYTEAEAIGQSGEIFFTVEDRAIGVPGAEMTHARAFGRSSDERWHMRKDGTQFWGSGVMLPITGHQRDCYVKIFRDNTERRVAHERQQLLTQELSHRVKNMLATVQSVAMMTLSRSATLEEARDAFEQRLVALARAHDILVSKDWSGSDMRSVVVSTLGAYLDGQGEPRIHFDGPNVLVKANAVLGLSLALNELATNAGKYGALSNTSGHVELNWEIAAEAGWFQLSWVERGGPEVKPPQRRGFGSRVIEGSLAQELQGSVDMKFEPEGLSCIIRAPLREITGTE